MNTLQRHVSKHDALNRVTMSRTPPSGRFTRNLGFSPGDLNQAVTGVGKSRHTQRSLQGGERHPRAPSLPTPTKDGRDFRSRSGTPPTVATRLGQPPLLFIPPPQNLAMVVDILWSSNAPHGREDAHVHPNEDAASDHLQHVPCRHQHAVLLLHVDNNACAPPLGPYRALEPRPGLDTLAPPFPPP
jgi:hypothetical protein